MAIGFTKNKDASRKIDTQAPSGIKSFVLDHVSSKYIDRRKGSRGVFGPITVSF